MATNAANVYCTQDDMADMLSASAINLRVDDSPPTALGNAIAKAGNRIDWYLNRFYALDQRLQSDLVKDWAVVLAIYYLSLRRGNSAPEGVIREYNQTIADLTEIKKGQNEIPGISRRTGVVPTLSIKKVIQRPFNRGVIEVSRGSQVSKAENITRETDIYDRLGVNSEAILDNSI